MKQKVIGAPSSYDGTKMCWWCKHFNYSEGSPGYSDMTPGYDVDMGCNLGKWLFDSTNTSAQELRNYLYHAVDCSDFESTILKQIFKEKPA